jgi:hypothetical protein
MFTSRWQWVTLAVCSVLLVSARGARSQAPLAGSALTDAQLVTLGNATRAIGDLADEIANNDFGAIAVYWNALASTAPTNAAYWVWRTSVPPQEYTGTGGVVWTEVDTMTAGDARIFEWMTGALLRPLNPSDTGQRQGIADAFGPGTATRANLLAMAKREARRVEQLYARDLAAGTNAAPDTMDFEGTVGVPDISRALQLTTP